MSCFPRIASARPSVRPSSLDELFAISSVAAKKLETYGEGLLKVVAGS